MELFKKEGKKQRISFLFNLEFLWRVIGLGWDLPNGLDIGKVLKNRVFCNEWGVKIF